jgi:hypothetical protein
MWMESGAPDCVFTVVVGAGVGAEPELEPDSLVGVGRSLLSSFSFPLEEGKENVFEALVGDKDVNGSSLVRDFNPSNARTFRLVGSWSRSAEPDVPQLDILRCSGDVDKGMAVAVAVIFEDNVSGDERPRNDASACWRRKKNASFVKKK